MPSPYAKPSQQLFWDLVNRSNPQLKIPLSDDNCVIYGYPVAVTPTAATGMRNTRIRLYAKVGKGYKGEITLYYNRLNIASFFAGITPTITNYTANTVQTVLAAFNAAYGLNLLYGNRYWSDSQPAWALGMTIPDILPYSTSYLSGSAYLDNVKRYTTAQESLCWVGGVNLDITRIRGNPDFGTLITKPEIITMRKVPKIPDGTYNVPLLTWGHDFTDYIPTINNFLYNPSNRSYQVALAQMLTDVTGLPFTWGQGGAPATPLDLYGFSSQNVTVAMGAKYYTNTEDFNRCVILYRDQRPTDTPPLGSGWTTEAWSGFYADGEDSTASFFRHAVFIHYNA